MAREARGIPASVRRMAREIERGLARALPRQLTPAWMRRHGVAVDGQNSAVHTQMLSAPVWELLERPSKRWRPLFGLCMLEALGVTRTPYLVLFCSLAELCHTATLMVDDIEDNAQTRRGGPCIHLQYGVDVALNAANTLYFLPLQHIMREAALTEAQRLELLRIATDCYVRGHFGQAADIYRTRHLTRARLKSWLRGPVLRDILASYVLKTASGIEALAGAACVLADAPRAARDACTAFARAFGVAFQIMDDVNNFAAVPRGAQIADDDIAAGKLTYVVAQALKALPRAEQEELMRIVCGPLSRKKAAYLHCAHELVRESGALEACYLEARIMMELAWVKAAAYLPHEVPRRLLYEICRALV